MRLTSRGLRLAAFVTMTLVVAGVTAAYALREHGRYQADHNAAPRLAKATAVPTGPRIVFRHTGLDREYGRLAVVSLDRPSGARSFTDVVCDRVDATADRVSCLRSTRGMTTRFDLVELDGSWSELGSTPVAGIPSRTRLSADGSLVARTAFVTGHSYLQAGFSTATVISDLEGHSRGNLERFTLRIDGRAVRPADRNVWGVTFASDRRFYATVGTGGRTYLVAGDLTRRTLTSVRQNAECPSLSPDGRRIAYKVDTGRGRTHWTPAVLDLATGRQTLLAGETRGFDDQLEWLDDDTLLYGRPRADEAGVSDVWALDTRPSATPRLLIRQAWSPAVVRSTAS